MKLPWDTEEKDRKIEQLEEKLEQLEEEKERIESQLESEKQRRKKHTRQKQEAEEELNRLKDRLRSLENEEEDEELDEETFKYENLSFSGLRSLLEKLGSVTSPEKELVTVYAPEGVGEVEKELKNSVNSETFSALSDIDSFAAFIDPQLGTFLIKSNAPLNAEVSVGKTFDTSQLEDFIHEKKVLATVSAGDSTIYREEAGEYEEVERVTSRVDHEHSSGGFSQGRFERKRHEQVEEHLDRVRDALEGHENVYLLGEKRMCKDLEGSRLGGFDPNASELVKFYNPKFARL